MLGEILSVFPHLSFTKLGCEFRKSDSGVYSSDETNFDRYWSVGPVAQSV